MTNLIEPGVILSSRRKNHIINGNFNIWQRGTSLTSGTGNRFIADRFYNFSTETTYSTSQGIFTLGQTEVPNEPEFYHSTVITTAGTITSNCGLKQTLERVSTLATKTVAWSFYAKADSPKNITLEFIQNFGTGGSPSANVDTIGVTTISLTTSWQKFTGFVTLPDISSKTLGSDNNDFLIFNLWFEAGSNFNTRTNSLGNQSGTFDIAQVQLEEGSVPTNFEIRNILDEILLCKRYWEFRGRECIHSYDSSLSSAHQYRTTDFLVAKRDVPTVTFIDLAGNLNRVSYFSAATPTHNTGINFTQIDKDGIRIQINSIATGRGLLFEFEADAELVG